MFGRQMLWISCPNYGALQLHNNQRAFPWAVWRVCPVNMTFDQHYCNAWAGPPSEEVSILTSYIFIYFSWKCLFWPDLRVLGIWYDIIRKQSVAVIVGGSWSVCIRNIWGAMWELKYLFEIISLFQTINEHFWLISSNEALCFNEALCCNDLKPSWFCYSNQHFTNVLFHTCTCTMKIKIRSILPYLGRIIHKSVRNLWNSQVSSREIVETTCSPMLKMVMYFLWMLHCGKMDLSNPRQVSLANDRLASCAGHSVICGELGPGLNVEWDDGLRWYIVH
jgi:hypothetical protein